MEIQSVLALIQAFTDHGLTALDVEDGGVKVSLRKENFNGAVSAGMTVRTGAAGVVQEAGSVGSVSGAAGNAGLVSGLEAAGSVGMVPGAAGAAGSAGVMPGAAGSVGMVPGVTGSAGVVPGTVGSVGVVSGAAGSVGVVPGAVGNVGVVSGAVGSVGVVPGTVGSAGMVPGAAVQAAAAAVGQAAGAIESDKVVVSPLVGVFYSASSPDAENFVKVGDVVKKGQVLGIIEAMKLMNEIESEYDGVVEAILVSNEDVVEYNQPLFRIR